MLFLVQELNREWLYWRLMMGETVCCIDFNLKLKIDIVIFILPFTFKS